MIRFVFMIYVARSGSTVLAHQIAERTRSVLVLPEFQSPHILFRAGDQAVRRMSATTLARLLTTDPQLPLLDLSRADVRMIAERAQHAGIRSVLNEIVTLYRDRIGSTAETVILKKGALAFFHGEISRQFPESRLIHPFRDPRGVVNSLIHTRDPYGARPLMARGDTVVGARYWRRLIDEVEDARGGSLPILEVRYEDLLDQTDARVMEVLNFLGVESDGGRSVPLPAAERSMHALVNSPPVAARSDAWKTELAEWQGITIETITGDRLRNRGYDPWYLPNSTPLTRMRSLGTAAAAYFRNTAAHSFRVTRHRISPRRDSVHPTASSE